MEAEEVGAEVPEEMVGINKLSRSERISFANNLAATKPVIEGISPIWWNWRKCVVNVLIVTDGGLDFGLGGFGLSEFITSFERLEQESNVNIQYRVTLGHRKSQASLQFQGIDPMLLTNNTIHNRITDFNFDTSVTLSSFDQVWIFGISSGQLALSAVEITTITDYMNGGGGLFCTGDHGSLGAALCSQIPRVKDMRHWADTDSNNDLNEVSMNGRRRNDTNQPDPGNATSTSFANQSDNIPQKIAVRTFGGGMPHPLLSISTNIRPSGIIDIMPDHPHEGECKQETSFTVAHPRTAVNHTIYSQIIATSFVIGGNTSGGKNPTVPHCFPSISVWDGRPALHGRIAIDSTWHHFVNINLTGSGSGVGLDAADFDVIQNYYMNTARWISRRKFILCSYKFILVDMLKNSQIIESSMDVPDAPLEEIAIYDLHSIGALAREIMSDINSPAFAEEFMLTAMEEVNPTFAKKLNNWRPREEEDEAAPFSFTDERTNFDRVVNVAVGTGFIVLRDHVNGIDDVTEETGDEFQEVFLNGVTEGLSRAFESFQSGLDVISETFTDE